MLKPGRIMLIPIVLAATITMLPGLCSSALAKGGDLLWTGLFPSSALRVERLGKQIPIASVTDANGDTYITGHELLPGSSQEQLYTVKVTSAGAVKWRAIYQNPNPIQNVLAVAVAADVAADGTGNVFVTGNTSGGGVAVIKYSFTSGTSGTISETWVKTYDNASATSIAFDGNKVYVGGVTANKMMVLSCTRSETGNDLTLLINDTPGAANAIAVNSDGIVVTGASATYLKTIRYKLDGSGKWWESANTSTGSGSFVKIASNGDVVAAGSVSTGGYNNIHTVKYSKDPVSGTTGNVLWSKTIPLGENSYPDALGLDTSDNVFVTGHNSNRIYTAGYLSDGSASTTFWPTGAVVFSSGSGYTDQPKALVIDSGNDSLFVAGYTVSAASSDFRTIKYRKSTGDQLWSQTFQHLAGKNHQAIGIGLDSGGNPIVTGYADETTPLITSTTTAASTAASKQLVDNYYNPGLDAWKNYYVMITSGASSGQTQRIVANSGGTLTLNAGIATVAGDGYYIYDRDDHDYYAIKYDRGALNAPSSLTAAATTNSNTSITLTWQDNNPTSESDPTQFRIERCTGEDHLTNCSTFSWIPNETYTTAKTYTDSGLASDKYYYYRVMAHNTASGDTYYSNTAHAATQYVDVPATNPTVTYSYTGNVPSVNSNSALSVATSPVDGNPVVTGNSFFTPGGFDYYTVKLDRANLGNIWSKRYGYPQNYTETDDDVDTCVAVDNNGQIVVSGFSYLYNVSVDDYMDAVYSIKYDSNGIKQWDHQYNAPGGGNAQAIAVAATSDASNNVALIGMGLNTPDDYSKYDIYVLHYPPSITKDANGAITSTGYWSATRHIGADNRPTAVTFDPSGNVIVTGFVKNPGTGRSDYDIYTAKYAANSSGANITPLWEMTFDGKSDGNIGGTAYRDDEANDVAVDKQGNVYVTGFITNANGNRDFITIKYDKLGTIQWYKSYDGPAGGDDEAVAIKVDPIDGNIVVGGDRLTDTLTDPANDIGNYDFQIIRYRANNGSEVWSKTLLREGSQEDLAGVAMDSFGSVLVTGNSTDLVGINAASMLTVKVDWQGNISGNATGYTSNATPPEAKSFSIAVNKYDEAFVVGYTKNSDTTVSNVVMKIDAGANPLKSPNPVAATPASYSSVRLDWTGNATGESGYQVARRNGACPAEPVVWNEGTEIIAASLSAGAITYTDSSGPTAGNTYCYGVRAFHTTASNNSRWVSITVTIGTPPPPIFTPILYPDIPNATTDVVPGSSPSIQYGARASSTTSVRLTWGVPNYVQAPTGYEIQRCMDGPGHTPCTDTDFAALSPQPTQTTGSQTALGTAYNYIYAEDATVCPGVTYRYRIKANGTGSGWPVTSAVMGVILPTPDNLAADGGFESYDPETPWFSQLTNLAPADFPLAAAYSGSKGFRIVKNNTNNDTVNNIDWNAITSLPPIAAIGAKTSAIGDGTLLSQQGWQSKRALTGLATDTVYMALIFRSTTTPGGSEPQYGFRDVRIYDTINKVELPTLFANGMNSVSTANASPLTVWFKTSTNTDTTGIYAYYGNDAAGQSAKTTIPIYAAIGRKEYILPVKWGQYTLSADAKSSLAKGYLGISLSQDGYSTTNTKGASQSSGILNVIDSSNTSGLNNSLNDNAWHPLSQDILHSGNGSIPGNNSYQAVRAFIASSPWDYLTVTAGSGYGPTSSTNYTSNVLPVNMVSGTVYVDNIRLTPKYGLTATRANERQIDLKWSDSSFDATGYKIERCDGTCDNTSGTWSPLPTTVTPNSTLRTSPGTVTTQFFLTYSDTGLTPGNTYTYRVYPYKSSANSCGGVTPGWSGGWNGAPSDPPATATVSINPITTLNATAPNTTQVNLTWTGATVTESGFEIWRCSGTGCSDFGTQPLATVGPGGSIGSANSYNDTTACNNTPYTYKVKAKNNALDLGDFSNTASTSTPAPAAPTGLTPNRVSEGRIDLSWTDNATDETGYKIQRCTGDGCTDFTDICTVNCTNPYNDTSVTPGLSHTYRVYPYKTVSGGCDGGWTGPYSNTATQPATISAPTLSTPTTTSPNSTLLNLSWIDTTSSETGFEIWRCVYGATCTAIPFPPIITSTTGASTGTQYTLSDTSVCPNQTYNYKIRAIRSGTNPNTDWPDTGNGSGNGPFSSLVSKATLSPFGIATTTATGFSNSGFDTDLSSWTTSTFPGSLAAPNTVTSDSSNSYDGTKNLHLYAAPGNTQAKFGVSQAFTVTPGATYWLKGVVFKNDLSAGKVACDLTGTNITTSSITSPAGQSNNWQFLSAVPVVIPFGTTSLTVSCYVDTYNSAPPVGDARIDGLRIQQIMSPFTAFSVATTTETQIQLAWTVPAGDQTGFKIDRCSDNLCATVITTITKNIGDYDLKTTDNLSWTYFDTVPYDASGATYYYRIRAFKSAVCGWETSSSTIISGATKAPGTLKPIILPTKSGRDTDNLSAVATNCDDIRVTRLESDGTTETVLPIYNPFMAGGNAVCGQSATVFIFKTDIQANPSNADTTKTRTYYLYYGNPNAPSVSDGAKVFTFFDDFDGINLDTTKWDIANSNLTGFSLGNGKLTGANSSGRLLSLTKFPLTDEVVPDSTSKFKGYYLQTYIDAEATPPTHGFMTAGFYNSAADSDGLLMGPVTDTPPNFFYYDGGSFTQMSTRLTGATSANDSNRMVYTVRPDRTSVSGSGRMTFTMTNRDFLTAAGAPSTYWAPSILTNHTVNLAPIALGRRFDDNASHMNETYSAKWDQVRVRKYASPGVSKGALQPQTSGWTGGLSGWSYRRSFTLTNTNSYAMDLTEYQQNTPAFDTSPATSIFPVTDHITVNWTDTTSTEDGFYIYRCKANAGSTCTPDLATPFATVSPVFGSGSTVSYVDGATEQNKVYCYQVKAYKGSPAWTTTVSDRICSNTTYAPSIPVITNAVAGAKMVNITWTDNSIGESGYKLERCHYTAPATTCDFTSLDILDGSNPYKLLPAVSNTDANGNVSASIPNNTYSDMTVACYGNYRYRISAYFRNDILTGDLLTSVPTDNIVVGTLPHFDPINVAETWFDVKWADSNASKLGTELKKCSAFSDNCIPDTLLCDYSINNTAIISCQISPTCLWDKYRFQIRTHIPYDEICSPDSYTAPVISDVVPNSDAPSLTATAASEGSVNLSWTYSHTNLTGYYVYRCKGSGCTNFETVATLVGSSSKSYLDSGLEPGTTYLYKVNAYKNGCDNESPASAIKDVTTTSLAQPTNLAVVTATSLRLTWTSNTATETGYNIYKCSPASGSTDCDPCPSGVCTDPPAIYVPTAELSPSGSQRSYTDVDVCPDSYYKYQVMPVRNVAPTWTGPLSDKAGNETPTPAIQLPTNLTATVLSDNEVQLNWLPSAEHDQIAFDLMQCTVDGTCPDNPFATTNAATTSYRKSDLLGDENKYCYKVAAVKNVCDSSKTSEYTSWADNSLTGRNGGVWSNKAPVNITDRRVSFQTRLTISKSDVPEAKADFSDIRLYNDTAKTEISHWLSVSGSGSSAKAIIWFITPANNGDAIYLYYGNASATSTSNRDAVFGNNLVGYWPFEEAANTTTGSTADASGNGNNGTLTNITTGSDYGIVAGGKFSNALSLNGSQYVHIQDIDTTNPIVNPAVNNSSVTVEAWAKYNGNCVQQNSSCITNGGTCSGTGVCTGGTGGTCCAIGTALPSNSPMRFVIKAKTNSNNAYYALYVSANGNLSFLVGKTSPSVVTIATSASAPQITNNDWHHYVGRYDGLTNTVSLVIDGDTINTYNTQAAQHLDIGIDASAPVTIGAAVNDDGNYKRRYFNGLIDDVRIYNRALTDIEITSHYAATLHTATLETAVNNACITTQLNRPDDVHALNPDDTRRDPIPGNTGPGGYIMSPYPYKIPLAWNDNSGQESGYIIERKVDNEPWVQRAVVPCTTVTPTGTTDTTMCGGAGTRQFIDTVGIDPQQTYTYRIRGIKTDDNMPSPYSSEFTVVTPAFNAPTVTDHSTCCK